MAADIFATNDADLRKRWALMQMKAGADGGPAPGPIGALARALQGTIGGYVAGQAEADDKKARVDTFSNLTGMGGGSPQASAESPAVSIPTGNTPVAGDMSVPRGIRNNNPLNIEAGAFTQGQPGFVGSDNRFAKFETPQQGLQAANNLLDVYRDKHGLNTVAGIVGRWAPASDGNNVSAYAANVANKLGIGPNDPIPPEMRPRLIEAMGQHENGQQIQPYQTASLGPVGAPGQPAPPAMPPAGPQVAQAGGQPTNPSVPNRSSVQIPPDVQQTIKRLGADSRTGALAMQLYMQYAKPVESIQPMSSDQRRQWNVPEGVSAGIDSVTGKPVFSQPANSVNVNTAANPVLEGVGKQIVKQREVAGTAVNSTIPFVHETRKALDDGAITGAFADQRLFAKKVGSLFGMDDTAASNTEVLRSTVGNQVLSHIKELGANPSNADRDYIEKVQGGQIALEEKSMRRLLDITEKYARQTVRNFNRDSRKLMEAPGGDQAYKSISPLMNYDEPPEYSYKPSARPGAIPVAPAPSRVDPAAIEEARRRGLIP